MILEQLSKELAKYDAPEWLAERLIVYGKRPFVKYLVRKYVNKKEVYSSFSAVAVILGTTPAQARNAYYDQKYVKERSEVLADPGYDAIMSELIRVVPNKALWDDLLCFGFNQVRQFAIELAVLERGYDMRKICDEFKVCPSLAYRVRRIASKRFIERQRNGIEFNE